MRSTGRTLRYGELAADAAKITLGQEPAIKTPDQYTFIGKPMPRVDVIHKIDGSAKFGIDTQLPDMVFAAINACPVAGGKLKSVDDSPLAGAPGIIQVVRLDDAVAVVATGSFWRAKQALAKLQPEWDVGAGRRTPTARNSSASIARPSTDRRRPRATRAMSIRLCRRRPRRIEAVYETPYLSHSPMEPMNATVQSAARPARCLGRHAGRARRDREGRCGRRG